MAPKTNVDSPPVWVVYNAGGYPMPFASATLKKDAIARAVAALPYLNWAAMQKIGFTVRKAIVNVKLITP